MLALIGELKVQVFYYFIEVKKKHKCLNIIVKCITHRLFKHGVRKNILTNVGLLCRECLNTLFISAFYFLFCFLGLLYCYQIAFT